MAFLVGQRVTMKAPHAWIHWGRPPPQTTIIAVFGEVYTVAGIIDAEGYTYLSLCECDLIALFLAERFRPVKTTDVSVFTQMLAPTPAKKLERA